MNDLQKAPRGRRGGRRAVVVIAAVVLMCISGGPALAAWLTSGSGNTTVGAADLSTPGAPTVAPSGGNMAVVSWHATKLSTGQAATGYVVRRTDSSGTRQVCSVSAPTLSCTDTTAVVKTASYTVAATFANWSSAQSTAKVYEGSAPKTTISTDSSANSAGWWTTPPVGFTLNATDSASGVASITYQVGGASPVTVNAATTTFNVSAEGTTVITYKATDNVGNVEAQKSFTLKLDSVAPAAPTGLSIDDTGASATDGITDDDKPAISGTAEAGSTVEVRVDGTLRWTVTAAANGTFTAATGLGAYPPGSQLSEGTHVVSVRAIDAAGNVGNTSTLDIVIDTTNPTVTATSPTNNQSVTSTTWGSGCAQAGFCGTAADSNGVWKVTYQLKLKGKNSGQDACWDGTRFVGGGQGCKASSTLTATGTTSWSVALPYSSLTAASTYVLTLDSFDLAGNSATNLVVNFTTP